MQKTYIDVLWIQHHKNHKVINLLKFLSMMLANMGFDLICIYNGFAFSRSYFYAFYFSPLKTYL